MVGGGAEEHGVGPADPFLHRERVAGLAVVGVEDREVECSEVDEVRGRAEAFGLRERVFERDPGVARLPEAATERDDVWRIGHW